MYSPFRNNIEYCGWTYFDSSDRLITTDPVPGTAGSCRVPVLPSGARLASSWHTHGKSDGRSSANETPSNTDLRFAASMGNLTHYVSTPGGRLWIYGGTDGTARQLCYFCMPKDPNHIDTHEVPQVFGSSIDLLNYLRRHGYSDSTF